ncbi:hypothetical protein SAMN04515667_1667 [Formosa sp. Hel1_31_208]|uniref:hypothetical protein n=1 Tax=Formosa sp. Hel1_31_208 TaxID=1798225 RepID=UPI00087C4152|nr:hypothetical protein [Formosa sp. Hel1_31_208]SDS21398.1 hypothetical protein SAMN04515667_1667 [Formosa sp. Hel1_31_208]
MKTPIMTLITILIAFTLTAQDSLHITDFDMLNNTSWKGQLTYKDYQSNELKTIPSTLQIQIKGDRITTNIQYTYEPQKNNKSTVKIKKNGTYFGNEKIIENSYTDGLRRFVTTFKGRDNGMSATMFIIHEFNETNYKVIKEVQLDSNDERFIRNTYEFTKIIK